MAGPVVIQVTGHRIHIPLGFLLKSSGELHAMHTKEQGRGGREFSGPLPKVDKQMKRFLSGKGKGHFRRRRGAEGDMGPLS